MFDLYRNRVSHNRDGEREAIKKQSVITRELLFNNSQSYKSVEINGERYDARMFSDVNDTVKTGDGSYKLEFRDGISFYPGTYVKIKNIFNEYDYWIIADIVEDFRPQFLIKKCVYQLKWKNSKGKIVSRWAYFDDSYKMYDGTRNYGYKTNLPESSITICVPIDNDTINIKWDQRFLLDVYGVEEIAEAYEVTNRNVLSRNFLGHGILKLSLSKTQFNHETDNKELMIADYYQNEPVNHSIKKEQPELFTRAEIAHKGQGKIVMGTSYKEFKFKLFDASNKELDVQDVHWQVLILPEFREFFDCVDEQNMLKIKAKYNENLESYEFKIVGQDPNSLTSAEMRIKVVSGI